MFGKLERSECVWEKINVRGRHEKKEEEMRGRKERETKKEKKKKS